MRRPAAVRALSEPSAEPSAEQPAAPSSAGTRWSRLARRVPPGLRRPGGRGRRGLALGASALLVAGIGTAAVRSPGYDRQQVAPNDGTVWVTNDRTGFVGRLNAPAGALDAVLQVDPSAHTHQLDVVQGGSTTLARDRVAARLTPIDQRTGALVADKAVAVPSSGQLESVGGTTLLVDPATGQARAARAGDDGIPAMESLRAESKAVASVAVADSANPTRGAAGAISPSGVASVVGSTGDVVTLTPTGDGSFTSSKRSLGAGLKDVQAAAVGERLVIVDTDAGTAVLPDGRTVALPAAAHQGVLQESGPQRPEALIATTSALLALDLDSGQVRSLRGGITGEPSAPVVDPGCAYAAWSGNPGTVLRRCGDDEPTVVGLAGARDLRTPRVRSSRTTSVLNDGSSGAVWDLSTGRRLDDWAALAPQSQARSSTPHQGEIVQVSQRRPRAVDDRVGIRPVQASIVHPLDNDDNPAGSVLSIRSVAMPPADKALVTISPDAQTLQVLLRRGVPSVSFGYTIDDARGNQSSATITLVARADAENSPPVLRTGYVPKVFGVVARGRLSIPVIGDWRDPDSDPVVLVAAHDGTADVPVSADGRLLYVAGATPGLRTLRYDISDGRALAHGSVQVQVLPEGSTQMEAATPLPDVARGEVRKPIVIRPLDNDLPGVDPTSPQARLSLAADVVAPQGVTVTTSRGSGTVTVTASTPGTRTLTYTVAYGGAPLARGTIRVDVSGTRADAGIVAMLDQAVVHEQVPALVDVLANDDDPSGRLLAVQSAVPEDPADFRVAVVRGRWVRIEPLVPQIAPNPGRIRYTVTNGVSPPVTGEISVQQLPRPASPAPTPLDDHVSVRSGDGVVIGVLDNDTSPSGETLSLVAQRTDGGQAGVLPVLGPVGSDGDGDRYGHAYAQSDVVRFQAPVVTQAMTVRVPYLVEDLHGNRASAIAYVTVLPPPSADHPDLAPTPPTIEARVTAGDSVTIGIPTNGADPDGDSVTFLGLASAPSLGRIVATTPSSITYQAYPSSRDTDRLDYVVADPYGKRGYGTIRIAVLPPGDPQPPVAVDDTVTTRPGARLVLDPTANDIIAIGDTITMRPLESVNAPVPYGARLVPGSNRVALAVPGAVGPAQLRYAIRGSSGEVSTATIGIRVVAGANIPPIARNAYATPRAGASEVSVDVLSAAEDPDGDGRPLRITQVFDVPGARIAGRTVTVPVLTRPQVIGYEIEDADGGRAVASIYVPPVGAGAPVTRANTLISLDRNRSTEVSLADLVVDPAGKPVLLTRADQLGASPAAGLQVTATGPTSLRVTATKDYVGPGAITFEVTNGRTATDPDAQTALLSVPVQVGSDTPVLRCPPTRIAVVQGGTSRPISVPELCHVWTPKPQDGAKLSFVGRFPGNEAGLSVETQGARTLVVKAAPSAAPGTVATLDVSIPGTQAAHASLSVLVTAAAAPVLQPVSITGLRAGATATKDLAPYIQSQLAQPSKRVDRIERVSGADVEIATLGGTTVTLTPSENATGRIVLRAIVYDVPAGTLGARPGTGTITIDVLGKPGRPGTPYQVGQVESHAATIGWAAPADNGMPIQSYTVTWPGGSHECPAGPCRIPGLTNGRAYSFTVVAHNAVGDSLPSAPSGPVMPNAVPGAPVRPTVSNPGDGVLTVSWQAAPVDGSPPDSYLVLWPGGSAKTTGQSVTATGLDNMTITAFTVKAHNAAGWGPAAAVSGQSVGTPPAPTGVALTPSLVAGGGAQAGVLTWGATSPNGPGPVQYTVTRQGRGGATRLCAGSTALRCPLPQVDNDGSTYTYTVTAANPVNASAPSRAVSQLAVGPPGEFGAVTLKATGTGPQTTLTFAAPAVHDSSLTVTCTVDGHECGAWRLTEPRTITQVIPAAYGSTPTVTLTATNRSAATARATAVSDVVHGLPTTPTITGNGAGGSDIAFTVAEDPQGAPADLSIVVDVGGRKLFTDTVTTTGQAWSQGYRVKVGIAARATITAVASRGGADPARASGSATSGTPAVAMTQDATGHLVLALRDFASDQAVRCEITPKGAKAFTVTTPPDADGDQTYTVPGYLPAGDAEHTISCDDTRAPAAPTTVTWTSPAKPEVPVPPDPPAPAVPDPAKPAVPDPPVPAVPDPPVPAKPVPSVSGKPAPADPPAPAP